MRWLWLPHALRSTSGRATRRYYEGDQDTWRPHGRCLVDRLEKCRLLREIKAAAECKISVDQCAKVGLLSDVVGAVVGVRNEGLAAHEVRAADQYATPSAKLAQWSARCFFLVCRRARNRGIGIT